MEYIRNTNYIWKYMKYIHIHTNSYRYIPYQLQSKKVPKIYKYRNGVGIPKHNSRIHFTSIYHYVLKFLNVKVLQPIEKLYVYPFQNVYKSLATNGRMTCVPFLFFICELEEKQHIYHYTYTPRRYNLCVFWTLTITINS